MNYEPDVIAQAVRDRFQSELDASRSRGDNSFINLGEIVYIATLTALCDLAAPDSDDKSVVSWKPITDVRVGDVVLFFPKSLSGCEFPARVLENYYDEGNDRWHLSLEGQSDGNYSKNRLEDENGAAPMGWWYTGKQQLLVQRQKSTDADLARMSSMQFADIAKAAAAPE